MINFNNPVERNFHGITSDKVEYFNGINASVEYIEDAETYGLYVNGDMVDQNTDPCKLKLRK